MSSITIASVPRMSREALSAIILNQAASQSAGYAIIDVRDSDHIGGHIHGSMHVPSSTLDYRIPELVRQLKDKDSVIFHCSLSQQRGPSAALRYARERKRLLGIDIQDEGAEVTGAADEIEGTAGSRQKVFILDGGFVQWQEKYGQNEKLTDDYEKDIWEFGY
ncbi:Cdc25 family phosphatase-like protein Ibp1 [Viridothelium virens]|uniref:Cdc25 family phosphatase-like protein Ibp1 n=1 Tax=Viridothelium virens TaxID=1048519 RepID=A0A6A6HGJ9_VIRVR|nr:Cdc25 family phosphatase-like protein Ibp1 [Viridothelium virens]